MPTRCSIQNAAVISHQTCSFFTLPVSPPHPLTCSRWKFRITHSVTFPSSPALLLMHHSVPTTLPPKRISIRSLCPASPPPPQSGHHHFRIIHHTQLVYLFDFSSLLATSNPPGNPGLFKMHGPLSVSSNICFLSTSTPLTSGPLHPTQLTVLDFLHMAWSFSSFRSPLKCRFFRDLFPV